VSALQTGERYFAVQTLSGREISAAAQLNAQGFRPFLPLLLKSVRHARKFRMVRAPLFPNYLFVALDLQCHRWRSVNGTFGVVRLLMIGEFPALVPAGIVEHLMALIHFDKGLKLGQKLKILSGSFTEMIGELERIDGAGRVKLLLNAMGCKIPIMTTAALLAPAA
jgi:transcriptional antiterminator RfaH